MCKQCDAALTQSVFSKILKTDTPLLTCGGWDMGCLFYVQALINVMPQSLQWCMNYHGLLHHVIMTLHCIVLQLINKLYFDGILPKGPYPPCLRMADKALLAGHPWFVLACEAWKLLVSLLLGILQNMVNPSLTPTQPEGSELPTFSYGGESMPRVLKQYVFSPHGYIFPIRWSNQLNQSERLIYAPLTWITTDSSNGLVSSLCQAITWTNFDL